MTRLVALVSLLIAAVVGLASEASAAQASCTWQVQQLPAPTGATQYQVDATDHAGGYAGTAYVSGWRIVYWKNGQIVDYGSSGLGADRVVGQNRTGNIAAISVNGLWGERSTSFRIRNGQRESLPALPGAEQTSRAVGIADNDDVYGNNLVWQTDHYVTQVVRWPQDRPTVVERVSGIPDGMKVVDVDRDGTLLVGPDLTYPWPYLWRNSALTRLPEPPNTQHGYARSIGGGLVAGSLRIGSDSNHPAYWDRAGQPHQVTQSAEAIQINANGLFVAAQSATPYQVWRLGTFEAQLANVNAINTIGDDDSIGGSIRAANGSPAAAVWRCR